MAANDYYHDSSRHNAYEPSIASTNPPSYTTNAHPQGHPGPSTSPFDTVFDDHVYPATSHSRTTPDRMDTTQHTFAHDTRYHGSTAGDVSPITNDDIPLQPHKNNSHGYLQDSTDHVYDAPEQGAADRGVKKKSRLGFGELGMLGSERRRIPIFVYLFSLIQIGVFIGELVKAAQLTGSPIQTTPSFNPMIGPSQYVLISMGSRYVPCMKNVDGVQNYVAPAGVDPGFPWACPNSTTNSATDPSNQCSLSEICGFSGVPNPEWLGVNGLDQSPQPNQWFRFIVPIFMHAGIIHIGFNLLLQLTMGKEIERAIGSIRFFLVYMSSGIFGFVMGGNYAAPGISSTGASGALFGIIAITLLDLLYSWSERRNPVRELMFILVEIVISFVLGLLPGLDNFSHIGGFIVGLCLGISVLHSPNFLRRRIGEDHFSPSYTTVGGSGITSVAFPAFHRNPVGFFKGRKALWWAWWLVRTGCLVLIIVVFIVLLNNFYSNQNHCSWCKYLSCIPVNGWCDIGKINVTYVNTPNTTDSNSLSGRSMPLFALEELARFYA
ncbi:Uu.00g004480.m01.CDS01 [Anthostomella pinea]|uniref:Rhomboid-type serine protease n=1 Tax=Anthostomella pinea TaxID=933095 RepID=A0AAI8YIY1_9PEZI|nr:Uu.00g004480.m01.CDS01 [Anthostomella pinea]